MARGHDCGDFWYKETMTSQRRRRRARHKRDLHFLNEDGMVACNPRDWDAAHHADVEGIATEEAQAVTCKKCRAVIHNK